LQRRRSKEDARAYAVKLTQEGRRVLNAVAPTTKRVDEKILSTLPAGQRESFLKNLNAIVTALGKLSTSTSQ
jgi:DNA-binding MarR family transcriptional regulator